MALGLGLLTAGSLYTALSPQPQLATAQGDAAQVAKGQQLYNNACITCHGANLQGVPQHGPSLIGVGDAAVYFQVSSGRMPMARQEAQAKRKPPLPVFNPETEEGAANLDALGAFVQANGGGPTAPSEAELALRGPNSARGGELFRLNCASCHNFTGRGGALSSGKFAPILDPANDVQIYTAMLTGPQNMPKFSDRQLTPEEKKDIIAYIKSVGGGYNNNPGGNPLGGIGPVSEGLIAFIVGLVAMIGFAMWLGAKN
jgi:ubiquinol-cytochrome c reductase cytochrome c subunit